MLRSAVDEFSSWTLEAFERTFRRVGGLAWEHLRGEVRLMRFGLDEDPVAGRLGAAWRWSPRRPTAFATCRSTW